MQTLPVQTTSIVTAPPKQTDLDFQVNLLLNLMRARAKVIISEVAEYAGWSPITIYEPIPVCDTFLLRYAYSCHIFENQDRCVPEELPALLAAVFNY